MTSLRASDVSRRLNDPATLPPVILVFGPDRGLVTEVTDAISALFQANQDDPFSVVRLDAATVSSDPARLIDEAGTVSLFGERRLIVVRDGGARNLSPAVSPLLDQLPTDAVVVVEAGDLRRGTGLRKEVEDHRQAVAIYCPVDSERDLERMIDEEAQRLGLTVDTDARAVLVDRLGADRAASRAEVLKACLHAVDNGRLTVADVDAVVGDIALSQLGDAVDAAFLGQRETLDRLLTRLLRQDSAAVQLLMAAQRMSHTLELAAAAVAGGQSPSRAVEFVRPPLFGAHKDAAARILDRWTHARLRAASAAIADATFRTRTMPHLAAAVTRDVLYRIASQAAAR
ncbi:DNA polymerase III subunit delta [Acuticoccus kandeliae]|uniref:DNA polymerase III subunit delta n=1 Tax=Acuticoccus kandeliae TaxID=2073160 RepID=UPI000D3E1B2C|nr:DNA polymerase III subunit delta [Acuticoccus kandeliae]